MSSEQQQQNAAASVNSENNTFRARNNNNNNNNSNNQDNQQQQQRGGRGRGRGNNRGRGGDQQGDSSNNNNEGGSSYNNNNNNNNNNTAPAWRTNNNNNNNTSNNVPPPPPAFGGDQQQDQQQNRGGRGRGGNNRGGNRGNNRGGGGGEGAGDQQVPQPQSQQQGDQQQQQQPQEQNFNNNNNYNNNNNNNNNRGGYRGNKSNNRGGNRGGGNGGGFDPDYQRGNNNNNNNNNQQQQSRRPSRAKRSKSEEKEVEEMFARRHNQTGINFERYSEIPVQIAPQDIEPAKTFTDLNLHADLMANILRCGYECPTPVQRYGLPVAAAGKDVMACAQTGSGKTAAFLLVMINHVLLHGVSLVRGRCALPIGVIMAPTRELALQIFDDSRKFCYETDVYPQVAYGGVDLQTQIGYLLEGCDILVATPGRLKDMFDRERIGFGRVKYLVLDEADRMLDLGFEDDIRYIIGNMPDEKIRQTLLYSATFPKPIQNLARQFLKPDYYMLKVGKVGSTTKNITQRVVQTRESEKSRTLLRIINMSSQDDLILIFVATKANAEDICSNLQHEQLPCTSIHGDRKQWEREDALHRFKTGELPILVATDVASRGLDIPNVTQVIQYDLPNSLDDYVHRIGRTGRAGNKGVATAFFTDSNRSMAPELLNYLKDHEQEVPEFLEEVSTNKIGESASRGGKRGGRGGRGGGGRGGNNRRQQEEEEEWDCDAKPSQPRRGGGGGEGERRGGGERGGQRGGRGGQRGGGGQDEQKPKPQAAVKPSENAGAVEDGGF